MAMAKVKGRAPAADIERQVLNARLSLAAQVCPSGRPRRLVRPLLEICKPIDKSAAANLDNRWTLAGLAQTLQRSMADAKKFRSLPIHEQDAVVDTASLRQLDSTQEQRDHRLRSRCGLGFTKVHLALPDGHRRHTTVTTRQASVLKIAAAQLQVISPQPAAPKSV
jgi:hypothetical protein